MVSFKLLLQYLNKEGAYYQFSIGYAAHSQVQLEKIQVKS